MHKLLVVLFAALVLIIGVFVVPLGDAADSAHSMLGGCAQAFGHKVIYKDYFSQHNPLVDDVMTLIYRIEGSCNTIYPRYVFFALFVSALVIYAVFAEPHISIFLLLSYAILSTRYDFQLPLAETLVASAGIVTALLFTKHRRMPRALVWVLFTASEFIYLTANPLYIPVGIAQLAFFFRKTKYSKLTLLLATIIPAILYFLHIPLKDYFESVVVSNSKYYPSCTGGVREILSHYFSPLKHFSQEGISRLMFETGIGLWAALSAPIYATGVGLLLAIRPEGFHLGPYVLFALALIYLTNPDWKKIALLFIFMLFLSFPIFQVTLSRIDTDKLAYITLVNKYSQPNDNILVYPGRPEIYLLTGRWAGSYYSIFGPCTRENAQERVTKDIQKNDVTLILIDNKHNAFGKGNPVELLARVIAYLRTSGKYVTIPVDTYITVYRRL